MIPFLDDPSAAWDNYCAEQGAAAHDEWCRKHPMQLRLQRLGRFIRWQIIDRARVFLGIAPDPDEVPF